MPARTSTRTSTSRPRTAVPVRRRRPGRRRRSRRPSAAVRARRRALLVRGGWIVAVLAVVGLCFAAAAARAGAPGLVCFDAAGKPVDPGLSVAGYGGEQLANAKTIVDTGAALGAPRQAQEIAVMTAMGESGLRVLDYGDAAGPDSRGLFQQRANGAWGSYEDRMNPAVSAGSFYRVLLALPDWQSLEPTIAAHRVQRNADERHYQRWFPAAQEVVAAVSRPALDCSIGGNAG
ncbi:hypothetical protein [Naasia sp. SYSU D00057]|uniref:hypothetical protein n=1 Tax=Naasia sp. SYSU D00057 TaxID=2817380 RepID=UPI0027DE87CF|nr:hypothetical protein [Naasia sp. SYSU D00057]